MKAINKTAKELITVREAAALLGFTENGLRGWLWRRKLPFYKLGYAVRLKRKEILEYRESSRIEIKS